jgi:peptidyl-prolyl cis-trans isomerase D
MAIIGKIRSYSKLVVIIIGVALAAFVLGDFVRKNPNKQATNIGEIAGDKIAYRDFELRVDEQMELLKQQLRQENLTAKQVYDLRQQVWQEMIKDITMEKEYDALGITVSDAELKDLITGKNPPQVILQSFTDPATGQFNPEQVLKFYNEIDQADPATQKQWYNMLEYIRKERMASKYNSLIQKGYYVTNNFAKRDFNDKNKNSKILLVVSPYTAIQDNSITLNEEDYQKYYDEHKYEFEIEASRDIEYVIFDVIPSESDIKKVEESMNLVRQDFEKTENIENFVTLNSDSKYDSTYFAKGTLPSCIDSVVFTLPAGSIIGPIKDNYTYTIAKVIGFMDRPDSMRASHILIAYDSVKQPIKQDLKRTKIASKKLVDSLLAVVKKDPKLFDTLAKQYSDDPSAQKNKGDLDWFKDETMVKPFNDACFYGKVGDITVVETDFGYHIIKVTEKKELKKKARVAIITRKIDPSTETYSDYYTKASNFHANNKTIEQFNKSCVTEGIIKRNAEYIREMDNSLPGLESARDIIRWAFNKESKKGFVSSEVFDLGDKYIIAVLKEIREKGIAPIEQIKPMIEPLVKREKKAEQLLNKMNSVYSPSIDMGLLAQKLNSKVDTIPMLSFSAYNLPGFGPEPDVLGAIYAMKKGDMSKPIKGKMGVFVIKTIEVTEAPVLTDFTYMKMQIYGLYNSIATYQTNRILEKAANVKDNRLLFY